MKELAILGDSGFAREVFFLVDEINRKDPSWKVVAFFARETEPGRKIFGVPVLAEEAIPDHEGVYLVTGMGSPAIKRKVVGSLMEKYPSVKFATLVHPDARMCRGEAYADQSVVLKEGSIVTAGTILTVNIEIGSHAHLNLDCTVGHDARIGDFATVSPGVHISGGVRIGKGAFIGTGTNIIEGITIGEGSVIGAGSCVTKDIPDGKMAYGVPAKVIKSVE